MKAVTESTPVVTGLGLVTALGFGVEATVEGLLAGRTGIAPAGDAPSDSGMGLVARVETPWLRTEVPEHLQAHVKFLNPAGEMAAEAAHEAWTAAGDPADVPPGSRGLWLSQMDAWDWGCVELRTAIVDATEGFTRPVEAETLNRAAQRRTKPFFILESLKNNAFSFISAWFELQGANTAVAGFSGGTAHLLDLAARAVRRGSLDRALVVGAGSLTNGVARRDAVVHRLSMRAPDATYRPLDEHGVGAVFGEGAAALCLERAGDARARGAAVHAALLGYGGATGAPLDGFLAPSVDTVRRAVLAACRDAEVEAKDVAAVVLPATGVPAVDGAMLEAVAAVESTASAPVVAWRGSLGQTALAGDLVDVVVAAHALAKGPLPGTAGVKTPLSKRVATAPFTVAGRAVLVVAAGLQGEAAAHVLGAA